MNTDTHLLTGTARQLQEAADKATPAGDLYPSGIPTVADLRYIELMHPGVGRALAELLAQIAERVGGHSKYCDTRPVAGPNAYCECPYGPALAVARALRGDSE